MWLLACRNLVHDRLRFLLAVAGIAFASFLMVFQGSLLVGFTLAASRVIDKTNADLWIMPRGVRCFDYPGLVQEHLREICKGAQGAVATGRVAAGVVIARTEQGVSQTVVVIGMDDEFAGSVPHPRVTPDEGGASHQRIILDETDAPLLSLTRVPQDIEVNYRRGRVAHLVTGFSSFRGLPALYATYADARDYLQLPPHRTSYLLVRTNPGVPPEAVRDSLRRRLPEVDIVTKGEFSRNARIYWLLQTGAGGALSLSAFLGFLIGLAVISQTTYATTVENIEEYATLKAIGASRWTVRKLVAIQALACGLAGTAFGFAAVRPALDAARGLVTWVETPGWIYFAVSVATLFMSLLASLLSVRVAISVEPGRVFRA